MSLLRSTTNLGELIAMPSVQSAKGPVCLTCGTVVDEEALVEGYPGQTTFARVLVRHHGAEELRTFDMGSSNWDERDLATWMRRTNWFNPHEHAGLGAGVRIVNPGDHDEVDK